MASYPENREKNRSPDILARELDFSFDEKMCFHVDVFYMLLIVWYRF